MSAPSIAEARQAVILDLTHHKGFSMRPSRPGFKPTDPAIRAALPPRLLSAAAVTRTGVPVRAPRWVPGDYVFVPHRGVNVPVIGVAFDNRASRPAITSPWRIQTARGVAMAESYFKPIRPDRPTVLYEHIDGRWIETARNDAE